MSTPSAAGRRRLVERHVSVQTDAREGHVHATPTLDSGLDGARVLWVGHNPVLFLETAFPNGWKPLRTVI